jgi:hypothetical protein
MMMSTSTIMTATGTITTNTMRMTGTRTAHSHITSRRWDMARVAWCSAPFAMLHIMAFIAWCSISVARNTKLTTFRSRPRLFTRTL